MKKRLFLFSIILFCSSCSLNDGIIKINESIKLTYSFNNIDVIYNFEYFTKCDKISTFRARKNQTSISTILYIRDAVGMKNVFVNGTALEKYRLSAPFFGGEVYRISFENEIYFDVEFDKINYESISISKSLVVDWSEAESVNSCGLLIEMQ
ncbi:MAG: hypothetical protein RR201_02145 [Malacoplasma sp.]